MPLDPDDIADPHERQRLLRLMLAVTDDDSVRHVFHTSNRFEQRDKLFS